VSCAQPRPGDLPPPTDPILEIDGLSVSYGAIRALRSVTLRVHRGEVVALLGANGAGKTTLLSAVMGLLPKVAGAVRYDGSDVSRVATEAIVRRGMTLTPEGRHVFANLTVADNLKLGAAVARHRKSERPRIDPLDLFPILRARHHQVAGTLSGGEQQQLAIARSLLSDPDLLLLDEPSLGLAPIIVDQIFQLVSDLRDRGITILLVEQNVVQSLMIADRAYVLDAGSMSLSGNADELRQSDGVERTYLGLGEP
jgi:branched-chain amino acid transport system ATP-binding protein